MSEPAIPERPNEAERYATMVLDLEAKVAGQAATFLAENRAMLKDLNDWVEKAKHAEKVVTQQAAIIERLTGALVRIGQVRTWVLAWRIAREALKDCGKWPHAALSKQEPK